jgi:hypothetical protein
VDVQFIPCDHAEPILEMMNVCPATSMTGRALLRGLAKYDVFDAERRKADFQDGESGIEFVCVVLVEEGWVCIIFCNNKI